MLMYGSISTTKMLPYELLYTLIALVPRGCNCMQALAQLRRQQPELAASTI